MEEKCLSVNAEGFAELCSDFLTMGKSVRFTAHGSSMHPLVRNGDILLVEPSWNNSLRVGAIVLCRVSSGRVVVHRVIHKRRNQHEFVYLIQGDNIKESDGWFSSKDIIGKIVSIERQGVFLDLSTPRARILALLVTIKIRYPHLTRSRVIRFLYSKMKRLPIFRMFFT